MFRLLILLIIFSFIAANSTFANSNKITNTEYKKWEYKLISDTSSFNEWRKLGQTGGNC